MEFIQVTLIGGPADLQRHVIDRQSHNLQVAYRNFVDNGADAVQLLCTTHTYRIRKVDHDIFVGIWQRPDTR